MKYETIVIGLLTPMFALIGIIIGSYLSYRSARDLFILQRQRELRERAYSRIMGLKVPIVQTLQTLLEAKMLTEFYDFRFQHFSGNAEDLETAKAENRRMLNLVPEFSKLQRELFEALGDVRISYDLDSEIENRIDGIYGFQMIVIQEPDSNSIKTQEDLDSWKEKVAKEMDRLLKFEFRVKIEALIPLLLKQIRKT